MPLTRHSVGGRGEGGAVEGGGSEGGPDRGGSEKKGREERKLATEQGRSHRSRGVREVGWEGQENIWEVVWGEPLQEGQRLSGALPIRSRNELRDEQNPERSCESAVR